MNFCALPLSGAFEITLEKHEDERGFFARIYCEEEFSAQGLNTSWVQMNMSFNRAKATLRGLHFQREPGAEIKLVRCLAGQVCDVIVDLRAGSPTFGHHCAVTLDAGAGNAIYIPKGLAHGFQTLTGDCTLQYAHSTPYKPGFEGGINALDPDLGINWPLPPAQMSDRDRALGPLKDSDPL
jgi:dTDP-4-dehydrorhamnose 3,5-epimerase